MAATHETSLGDETPLQHQRVIHLGVFLAFVLVYGVTSRSGLQVADEVAVFATGMNLATRDTLAIDELQWLEDALGEAHISQRGPDGHLYAKYFPGNVIGSAAIYTVAQRPNDAPFEWNFKTFAPSVTGAHLALGLNVLFGALAMTWLYLLATRHFGTAVGLATAALVGLGTDWWYQSRGFLSEVGAGALLLGTLYYADSPRAWASGAAYGASLLFRPLNLIAWPAWALGVWKGGRRALWSGSLVIAGLAALGLYNWLRFGSPVTFGYGSERFTGPLVSGLYGVLFSPGRSLFVYSPVVLLAIPGAWLLYQQGRELALAAMLSIGAYVGAVALWHAWDGGWTWGSRLLTPVVPIVGLLIAPVVAAAGSRRWLIAVLVVLGLLGFMVQVVAMARDPLVAMNTNVSGSLVPYEATLYSIRHSWLALQVKGLEAWEACHLDAYVLRAIITGSGSGC